SLESGSEGPRLGRSTLGSCTRCGSARSSTWRGSGDRQPALRHVRAKAGGRTSSPLDGLGLRFLPPLTPPPGAASVWGDLSPAAPRLRTRERAGRPGRALCRLVSAGSRQGPLWLLCAWFPPGVEQVWAGEEGSGWRPREKGAVPGESRIARALGILSPWASAFSVKRAHRVATGSPTFTAPSPAVDGCIHRAAGPLLTDECRTLQSCETGKAKITCGYRLPAKYVIHTVGPIAHGEPSASQAAELRSCYLSSLDLLLEHRLRSAAFPCISTGVFGYPNEAAAEVVLTALREWLEQHKDKVDRLIICVFLEKDENIYRQRLPYYFPVA
uniref:Mono-ADP ribosylhydrolase 1 n=1 Tax=Sus scrofa TaxID=9823 RepID=A0A8D1EWI8_PIG